MNMSPVSQQYWCAIDASWLSIEMRRYGIAPGQRVAASGRLMPMCGPGIGAIPVCAHAGPTALGVSRDRER